MAIQDHMLFVSGIICLLAGSWIWIGATRAKAWRKLRDHLPTAGIVVLSLSFIFQAIPVILVADTLWFLAMGLILASVPPYAFDRLAHAVGSNKRPEIP